MRTALGLAAQSPCSRAFVLRGPSAMASCWIARRPRKHRGVSYRVMFRIGGRETAPRYAGAFPTKREALARKAWVTGELAAMRLPDLTLPPLLRRRRQSERPRRGGRLVAST